MADPTTLVERSFAAHGDRQQRRLIHDRLDDVGFRSICLGICSGDGPIAIRRWAHEACAMLPGRACAAATRRGLADPAMTVRLHSLIGIAARPIGDRPDWLFALLADPSGGIRLNALEALAQLRPRAIHTRLGPLRHDDKAYVRGAVARLTQAATA